MTSEEEYAVIGGVYRTELVKDINQKIQQSAVFSVQLTATIKNQLLTICSSLILKLLSRANLITVLKIDGSLHCNESATTSTF